MQREPVEDLKVAQSKIDEDAKPSEKESPILRLPADLIVQIMKEYQCDFSDSPKREWYWRDSSSESVSWIGITHVSSHWRTIALSSPLLWNTIAIPYMPYPWVTEFFHRSGHAPLTLLIQYSRIDLVQIEGILTYLVAAKDRILSLEVSAWDPVHTLDLSSSPLKRFEAFSCTQLYKNWKPSFDLQHLSISYCSFKADLISRDLTTLSIQDPDDGTMPSRAKFYSILSSLTNLQNLTLEHVLSYCSKSTVEQGCHIHPPGRLPLPSLVSLAIHRESEGDGVDFFSRLDSPRLAKLHVVLDGDTPTTFSSFHDVMAKVLCNSTIFNPSDRAPFLYLRNMRSFGSMMYSSNHGASYSLQLDWDTNNLFTKLPFEFLSKLPLGSLQRLEFQWQDISFDDLLTICSSCPALAGPEHLIVSGIESCAAFLDSVPSCSCILDVEERSFDVESHYIPPDPVPACITCQQLAASFFPKLQALKLDMISPRDFQPSVLASFLAHRSDCGRPLRELSVNCFAAFTLEDKANALLLRGLGPVVQVHRTYIEEGDAVTDEEGDNVNDDEDEITDEEGKIVNVEEAEESDDSEEHHT